MSIRPPPPAAATAPRTILITGASGALGRRAGADLAAAGHRVIGLCLNPGDLPGIHRADLRVAADGWMDLFRGADAVLHLAGNPIPRIGWAEAQGNVAITRNVLEASRRHGVRRVVFASSNWVMAGHRCGSGAITVDMPVAPANPYAVSKYAGEELGHAFATAGILEFAALRIGYLPADGRFGPHLFYGAWGQEMWLAPDDFCAAARRALLEPLAQSFVVVNVMSRVRGSRWSLAESERALGFVPAFAVEPSVGAGQRLRARVACAMIAASRWLDRTWMNLRW